MATQTQPRLDPAIFRLPVDRIRQGYYSDAYFVYTKETLEAEGHHPHVTMQIFQKRESVLGGIDEAIAILKLCSGREGDDGRWISGWNELEVHALREGDIPVSSAQTDGLSWRHALYTLHRWKPTTPSRPGFTTMSAIYWPSTAPTHAAR